MGKIYYKVGPLDKQGEGLAFDFVFPTSQEFQGHRIDLGDQSGTRNGKVTKGADICTAGATELIVRRIDRLTLRTPCFKNTATETAILLAVGSVCLAKGAFHSRIL